MAQHKSVLLIGNYPPPYGGIPTHIAYLAPYLAAHGWDTHVLPIKYKPQLSQSIGQFTLYSQKKITLTRQLKAQMLWRNRRFLWRLRTLALTDPTKLFMTLNLAERIREIVVEQKVQILSAYSMIPAGLAAALVSHELNIPLVTTIFGEIYRDPKQYRKLKNELAFLFSTSQKLLSCSAHCANSPPAIGFDVSVTPVLYGIDTSQFTPNISGSVIRQRLGLSDKDRIVLYVGRLTTEMGLHVLLECIPEVLQAKPQVRFIIAGQKQDLTDDAGRLADSYPHNVFVLPNASQEDLPLIYAAATITTTPSINERACLGLASAESLATGKPVIMTHVGGGPEIVNSETGILIPPGNSTALAQAILQLIDDEDSLRRMGLLGRERAINHFDKETTNQKIQVIFETLL